MYRSNDRQFLICSSSTFRGGATILRVRGRNITASEATRKFLGLYPHIMPFWGYNSFVQRESYITESLSDSVATISYSSFSCNFSRHLNTFQIPDVDVVFKYFAHQTIIIMHTANTSCHLPIILYRLTSLRFSQKSRNSLR